MRLDTRNRRRSGASMVESAFVISIFLLLLFGVFEYGRFIMTKQLMQNAAREGARWAVVHTYDGTTSQVRDTVDAKLSQGRQQLVGYTKTSNIQVFAADASGNVISGKSWTDTGFGENIGVTITGTYRPSLPNLLKMNSSFTVSVKAVMASEAN